VVLLATKVPRGIEVKNEQPVDTGRRLTLMPRFGRACRQGNELNPQQKPDGESRSRKVTALPASHEDHHPQGFVWMSLDFKKRSQGN
jgi:hypothetical protein